MSKPRTVRFGDEVDALLVEHAENLGVQPTHVIKEAVEQHLGFRSRPDQMHVPDVGPEGIVPLTRHDAPREPHEQVEDPVISWYDEPPVAERLHAAVHGRSALRSQAEAPYVPAHVAPRVTPDGTLDEARVQIRRGTALRCQCGLAAKVMGTRCTVCGGVV